MVNVPGGQAGKHFCPERRGDGKQLKGRGLLDWPGTKNHLLLPGSVPDPDLRTLHAYRDGPTVKVTARSVPLEGYWGLGALGFNYSEMDIVNSSGLFHLFFFADSFHGNKKNNGQEHS